MKNKIFLPALSLCLILIASCKEEDLLKNATPAKVTNTSNTGNTGATTAKNCSPTLILMKDGTEESKMSYQYNAKGLVEKFNSEGLNYKIEYDTQDRPTKLTDLDKANNYDEIVYDEKGFLSEIRVFGMDEKGKKVGPFINKITVNAKGEIMKISYNLAALSMRFGAEPDLNTITTDINFEYDNNTNLKKITTLNKNKKLINLVENTSFDTKTNPFSKNSFQKAFIFEILGLAFFGEDLTYSLNKNNPNQTKITSIFADEPILIDYKYDSYNQQGYPEKYVRASTAFGNRVKVDWNVVYSCK